MTARLNNDVLPNNLYVILFRQDSPWPPGRPKLIYLSMELRACLRARLSYMDLQVLRLA